jgi:hypothetical protein
LLFQQLSGFKQKKVISGFPDAVLLDAIYLCPMPGDPSNDNYDDMLPDFCHPLVLTMGVVSSAPDGGSGGPVTFPVSVSEYIRGAMKDSTIMFVFCRVSFVSFLIPLIFLLEEGLTNLLPIGKMSLLLAAVPLLA